MATKTAVVVMAKYHETRCWSSLLLSALVCSVVSACKPQNFDWGEFSTKITLIDDDGGSASPPSLNPPLSP